MPLNLTDFLRPSPLRQLNFYMFQTGGGAIFPTSSVLQDPAVRLYASALARLSLCFNHWEGEWRTAVPDIFLASDDLQAAHQRTLGALLARVVALRSPDTDTSCATKYLAAHIALKHMCTRLEFGGLTERQRGDFIEACKEDVSKAKKVKLMCFIDHEGALAPPPGMQMRPRVKLGARNIPKRSSVVPKAASGTDAEASSSQVRQSKGIGTNARPSERLPQEEWRCLNCGHLNDAYLPQAESAAEDLCRVCDKRRSRSLSLAADTTPRHCPECQEVFPETAAWSSCTYTRSELIDHIREWHSGYALAAAWRDRHTEPVEGTGLVWTCPSKLCDHVTCTTVDQFEQHLLQRHSLRRERRIPAKVLYPMAIRPWGGVKDRTEHLDALEARYFEEEDEARDNGARHLNAVNREVARRTRRSGRRSGRHFGARAARTPGNSTRDFDGNPDENSDRYHDSSNDWESPSEGSDTPDGNEESEREEYSEAEDECFWWGC